MKIIERYLLREFLKTFLLLTAGLSIIITIFSTIEIYPDISGHNPSPGEILRYSIINIPNFSGFILPALSLIGAIFVLGKASKERELIAMMSSGINLRAPLRSIILSGVIITIIGMVVMNLLMPLSKKELRKILEDIKNEPVKKTISTGEGGLYLVERNRLIMIELYEPETKTSRGVNIFKIKDGRILERIYAKEGKEIKIQGLKRWSLSDVYIYDLENGVIRHEETWDTDITNETESILRTTMNPEEMDSIKLFNYLKALKRGGLSNTRLMGDMGIRLSFSFITIGFILLGVSLPILLRMHGLVAGGVAIGISVLYWFFLSFMMSLGYSGVVHPFLAPWIPPLIFNGGALYLYIKKTGV